MDAYDSFMRKHLQHYGYYTGKCFEGPILPMEEFTKTYDYVFNDSSSESSSDEKDERGQDDASRTNQLTYRFQEGKMVPRLKEPRQLYGYGSNETATQQIPRWPAEVQVLDEEIEHIRYVPNDPEPLYKQTGMERMPMCRSYNREGRIVFNYEPLIGTYNAFLRSRIGGSRIGCSQASVELENEQDTTLIFESRFESGNLERAVQVGQNDYELWLRSDLYTKKHTQWYYFRVQNTRANTNYRFTIVNLMKPDSLYNNGMQPVTYSQKAATEKKIGWIRTGTGIKYYKNNAKYSLGKSERSLYSLTWTCSFTYDHDTVYFAHCYPYTYTDLQKYLNGISNDARKQRICRQKVLCRTLAGNLIYLLTITSPMKNVQEAKSRRAVVITSRVHPGETNASWMMKGFLDYLLSDNPDAKLLRDTFVFKIVPMLNPDGVIVGNYRCSLAARDLNRQYQAMLKSSYPSIYHTIIMIRKLMEEREVVVYCDLHGHSRKQNVFIYGCDNRTNIHRRLKERIFPVMLSKNASSMFSYESCKFKVQKSKEGTGRIVMWNLGIMNSYTLEATFCGSTKGDKKDFHFSVKDFEDMGQYFCDTLLDYCDPDRTKCTKILMEIEDRLKTEILEHLRRLEGSDFNRDLDDINLDEELDYQIESSDGGSDSSVSDGPPLQSPSFSSKFQEDVRKRKKLRSRKDRDKSQINLLEKKKHSNNASPAAELEASKNVERKWTEDKTTNQTKRKSAPKVAKTKNPLSRKFSSSSTSTLPPASAKEIEKAAFTQEKDTSEGYLAAITDVYVQNNILTSKDNVASVVPHFRYSTSKSVTPSTNQMTAPEIGPLHCKTPETSPADATSSLSQTEPSKSNPPPIEMQQCKYQDVALPLLISQCGWLPLVGTTPAVASLEKRLQDQAMATILATKPENSSFAKEESLHKLPHHQSFRSRRPRSTFSAIPSSFQEARQRVRQTLSDSGVSKQHPPPFSKSLEKTRTGATSRSSSRASSAVLSTKRVSQNSGRPVSRRGSVVGMEPGMMLGPDQSAAEAEVMSGSTANSGDPVDVKSKYASQYSGGDGDINDEVSYQKLDRHQAINDNKTYQQSRMLPENHLQKSNAKLYKCHPETISVHDMQQSAAYRANLMHQADLAQYRDRNAPSTQEKQTVSMEYKAFQPLTGLTPRETSVSQSAQIVNNGVILKKPTPITKMDYPKPKPSNSVKTISTTDEITDTFRSIHEIRQSLMDPKKRTNISPTTGHFIDHFVKKTDQEISAIAAELGTDIEFTDSKITSTTLDRFKSHESAKDIKTPQDRINMDITNKRQKQSDSNRMQAGSSQVSQKPELQSTPVQPRNIMFLQIDGNSHSNDSDQTGKIPSKNTDSHAKPNAVSKTSNEIFHSRLNPEGSRSDDLGPSVEK